MKLPVGLVPLFKVFLVLALIAFPASTRAGEAPSTASSPAKSTATADVAVKDTDETASPALAKPDPVAADYWRAIKLLDSKVPAEIEAGRIALKAASDLEYTHAQVLLGNCHLSGSYGFPKNAKKAANLFRLAAERGNAFAKVSLALCYYSGDGVSKDETTAVNWLTAAIAPDADFNRPVPPADFFSAETKAGANADEGLSGNLGDDPAAQSQATAHHLLGQILLRQKKETEAQAHFVAAATAGANGQGGIYEAAQQAALNFAFGKGVPRDLVKANEMLDRARQLTARMGVKMVHNYASLKIVDEFAVADLEESVTEASATAQTNIQQEIATLFADKKSKEYNPTEAVKWYELAAENGRAWAMLSLAFIYVQGDLGQPDPVKAFHWFERAGGGDAPKHYLGVANLGICYQQGLGTAKDTEKAAATFKKHRDKDIICYLGSIGQAPDKVVTFEQALAINQTWAKKNNDPHAQYLLGLRYDTGAGVEVSSADAATWYKKASKSNHPLALYRLAQLYDKFPYSTLGYGGDSARRKAAEIYHKASDLKIVAAMVNYAHMMSEGDGLPEDNEQSALLYQQCLKLDPSNETAHNNLAVYYEQKLIEALKGKDSAEIESLRRKMLSHFEESVRFKGAYGAKNLADIYYQGEILPKDLRKAYQYFEQAAEWGFGPYAHYMLGLMHENGEGVPVTFSEAAYHYRLAALEGHIDALRRLVNFYIAGKGVSRDLDRATFWLFKLVQSGQPGAILVYVDILLRKGEYQTAVKLSRKLSDSENPVVAGFAYERLSLCYRLGYGVKSDPERTKKYLDKAVKLGNARALTALALLQFEENKDTEAIRNLELAAKSSGQANFYLGQMYFFGTKVTKDRAKAIQLLHNSASLEHPEAMYFLAGLTYNREANAPSVNEAIDLLQRAETLGDAKAEKLREKLEARRQKELASPADTSKARSS